MVMVEIVSSSPKIDSKKVLTFPRGIPGFEKYTTYLVYHKEENDLSAYWLESTEEPGITFTIVDPGQYGLSYDLELTDEERDLLQANGAEEIGVFMMLSKKEGVENSSPTLNANISGPVVINPRSRLGLQKVLHRPRVSTTIVQKG
ncbi:MAG: flagellar assembly protein FliW [Proteobacteria bacterium]|nr:flagellar assembly protein FliW [Pseudomonadota bacterium]